ncbi:alpha/beta fold hydrolase [Fredinandcohnia humi]
MKVIWKKVRRFMLYSLAFLIVVLIVGFVYQGISASKDFKKYQAVGKTYDVFNNKMHIYTGGEGPSTVVFNAGSGTPNPYVDFYPLYEKLDNKTKYAVIDRFGYGYSEITNRKREIDNIVDETRKLLQESGQKPPYIMVGHSLASLETIRYAQRYPEEVKGIVLLDAGNPEYYFKQKSLTFVSQVSQFLRTSGVLRVMYQFDENVINKKRNNLEYVPNKLKEVDSAYYLLGAGNKNQTDELRQLKKNAEKVLKANRGLEVPMTVITTDNFGEIEQDWLDSQEKLTSWSSSGKQIVAEDSRHYVHHYRPELVAEEILNMTKR